MVLNSSLCSATSVNGTSLSICLERVTKDNLMAMISMSSADAALTRNKEGKSPELEVSLCGHTVTCEVGWQERLRRQIPSCSACPRIAAGGDMCVRFSRAMFWGHHQKSTKNLPMVGDARSSLKLGVRATFGTSAGGFTWGGYLYFQRDSEPR